MADRREKPRDLLSAICQDQEIEHDPDTATMVDAQRRREEAEARLATLAAQRTGEDCDPAEEHTHARRSEQASYLREKLEERARSEQGDT
ncbi:MAG TPA: hypothetical protein VIJ51_01005 [Solirubrobacteraceae bacterium]